MPAMPAVLVIFPVHNEARNLERMLAPLLDVARREGYALLAIDDCSTDESPEILRRHGVAAIRLVENLGYGAAVQTGYKYALANGFERLAQLDGDGQHDPRFIPAMLDRMPEHDIVIGSRFLARQEAPFAPSRELYRGTPARRLGMRFYRLLVYAMTKVRIADPTSGFLVMNRACMRFLSGDDYPHDYPDADVILALIRNRFRISEVPVFMYRNDATGWLHRGIAPLWYVFKVTLSLLITALRRRG